MYDLMMLLRFNTKHILKFHNDGSDAISSYFPPL